MSNFLGNISGSLQAFAFAGSLALGLSGGCVLQRGGLGSPHDGSTDGEGGALMESGTGGDGGMDGGLLPQGPSPLRPTPSETLTPARAYFLWQDGPVPSGLSVAGYELCTTTGPMTDIDGDTECPNSAMRSARHYVIEPLSAGANYLWKVRTHFNDGSISQWSAVQAFTTNHSLVGWLKLDEGMGMAAADASGSGNSGTLVNTPTWAPGYIGQGLQFGGMSYVSVADASALNFGMGDFSLSAEVRTSSTGSRQAIVQKLQSGNGYYFYILTTGVLGFFGSGCGAAVSGGNVADGMWHRVMATRSGTTVSLYVDGAMTGSGTCTDNFSNASVLAIGCNTPSVGCVDPFQGTIDDVTIANAANANPVNDYCAALEASGADPLAQPGCAL